MISTTIRLLHFRLYTHFAVSLGIVLGFSKTLTGYFSVSFGSFEGNRAFTYPEHVVRHQQVLQMNSSHFFYRGVIHQLHPKWYFLPNQAATYLFTYDYSLYREQRALNGPSCGNKFHLGYLMNTLRFAPFLWPNKLASVFYPSEGEITSDRE